MKKVFIFGAGYFGKECMEKIGNGGGGGQIVGFLDNNPALHQCTLFEKYPCFKPDVVQLIEYDMIIIANYNSENEMCSQLLDLGVEMHKIFLFVVSALNVDLSLDTSRINFLKDYTTYCFDEAICGNVAECGVYKGYFAKYINFLFPDKKLYLLDTFSGFSEEDIIYERQLNAGESVFLESEFNHIGALAEPSVEAVMRQMLYPENVIVKKGWVPETFADVDDMFCFVNLDMDLYKPMLAAMQFFWDKMSQGGVILLHDYFFEELPGVRKAVKDFEKWLGRTVSKTPIGDNFSIALIKD